MVAQASMRRSFELWRKETRCSRLVRALAPEPLAQASALHRRSCTVRPRTRPPSPPYKFRPLSAPVSRSSRPGRPRLGRLSLQRASCARSCAPSLQSPRRRRRSCRSGCSPAPRASMIRMGSSLLRRTKTAEALGLTHPVTPAPALFQTRLSSTQIDPPNLPASTDR